MSNKFLFHFRWRRSALLRTPLHLGTHLPAPGKWMERMQRTDRTLRLYLSMSGHILPALTVHFCNYCGQQGNFRCRRCKKTSYCSVVCQAEDWNAHRHVCKSVCPNVQQPSLLTFVLVLPLSKHGDAFGTQRIYFKDLHMAKVIQGTEIQATVLEFYSPSRFFILAQSSELLGALQNIITELQKIYSCPSTTAYVPCVDEVCAVQYSTDLKWYRGLVKTLTADQKMAKILYIDYGNEEDVPVERIRPLANTLKPFSPCAMECCIVGVVPAATTWSSECCIAIRQLLAGKMVTVIPVETVGNSHVHAVDILLSMGKNLSVFLLEHGYGAKETVNTTPTEQDISAMVCASLDNFKRLSDGKDDNTWAQTPESMTQAVGDSFSVVVTHFQSPDKFVVQKVENAGVIQELQLKLREHCSQFPVSSNFRPAPGTVCCAQFSEDKQWYRAKVLAYSSDKHVCVGYLDFGNCEEVDLSQLQPISPSLLALPIQAVTCSLAGVQHVGEGWSEDCLLTLQRRVSNRILRIKIQGAHEGKALVTMFDEASDPQANVAELLLSAGYAAPAPVNTSNDQQAEKTTPSSAQDTQALEPLKWSWAELPCEGQTVALLASVVLSPGKFYCHINNPTDCQQLMELRSELKLHCEAATTPFEAKVGEPCCATYHTGDGAWYRAMVKELYEDGVLVKFVDHGFSMKVAKNHLRSITAKLLTLPFQAIRCWLTGVEPLGSEWSSEALLWFQTQVNGKLYARVLSVTEKGYGLELESRGQNVAAALLSQQLAKIPGEITKDMQAAVGSVDILQKNTKENEHRQMENKAPRETASSKVIPTDEPTATSVEAQSFPVDWKTMTLPINETFKPYIAAAVSPSLFYVLSPVQVDEKKLQEVMLEVAAYCKSSEPSLSSAAVVNKPVPGAACCAKFSGDNNWYRAVVLDVCENELKVIYADYGNSEKVSLSHILPIPTRLLQLPFQIIRCTLAGKEHFPSEWSEEAQQMFKSLLPNGVLATVQSFDGSDNVLSLSLPTENASGHVTAMILDKVQAQAKNSCPTPNLKADSTTAPTDTKAALDPPKSKLVPEDKTTSGCTKTTEPTPQSPEQLQVQNKNTCAQSVKG
uniref:Tudor domain containing 1 n=1 Tax=Sphaeramia orbicularis TaxID=375764 RepID=A0A673ANQ3_9TELE